MMGIIILQMIIMSSLQLIFTMAAGDNSSYVYKAIENIFVNCGSSTSVQVGDRTASPDINSPQFSLIQNPPSLSIPANTSSSLNILSSSANYLLYTTARLSRSEFTYSFQVTEGPKFVRLHFYPSSYSNKFSDRYSSLFSVKSGPFTLLKDFNASLTADNDEDSKVTVFREYCIYVQPGEQRLNVTFIPNTTMNPEVYAFINGIELVSMPPYLYYTNPSDLGFYIVGHGAFYQIESNQALETMYRINAGSGRQVPPEQDTGMFRTWDNEDQYLTQSRPDSFPVYFGDEKLKYTKIPNYTAPEEVYRTGRSYGAKERSVTYNVTWEFEVDSQFIYMVRLHFCEITLTILKASQRVFEIFIADELAEHHADVILWAKGILTPYYKDYAVWMLSSDQKSKKLNLSIKLQPYDDWQISIYRDVILNGIEIFKICDANSNLGGPNPDPRLKPYTPQINSQMPTRSNKTTMISVVIVGTASGLIFLAIISLIIRKLGTEARTKTTHGSTLSRLPSDLCRYFSILEIKAATNNFDQVLIIGVGGFGNVYKGYVDNNALPVAIKRLKPGSQQGAREFLTEILMLSQLRHVHLDPLIGYCTDDSEMILVYEFMGRGTLSDHLYGSECEERLSWKQRLEISLGAARGLHYLHTGASRNIIHRDVKSANILLDEKWVAKVSDFGLSKVGPTGISRSHISTVVKGSIGYLDPEYYKRQRLTLTSDVYSFGVVLLEVLCGRRPMVRTVEKQKANLVDWFRRCHHEGVIHEAVDPFLIESITPESLKAFSDMALSCLADDGNERPSMNEVVWGLEFVMKLQEESTVGPEILDDTCGTRKDEEEEETSDVDEEESYDVRFTCPL